jgi:hypothetical protein
VAPLRQLHERVNGCCIPAMLCAHALATHAAMRLVSVGGWEDG